VFIAKSAIFWIREILRIDIFQEKIPRHS